MTDYATQYYQSTRKKNPDNKPRKVVKPIPLPIDTQKIWELTKNESDETKSLIYLLYLSGARISEALAIQPKNFKIEYDPKGQKQILVELLTLKKRKGDPRREIPLKTSDKTEQEMLLHILRHVATAKKYNQAKLFLFSRQVARNRLAKITFTTTKIDVNEAKAYPHQEQHLYPHYLRHCRATQLAKTIRNPFVLQYLFGWSSPFIANIYIQMDWREASSLLLDSVRQY